MKNGGVVVRHTPNEFGEVIQDLEKIEDLISINAGSVRVLTVYGTELEKVRARFTNLPDVPNETSVQFHGDFAKFLAANAL